MKIIFSNIWKYLSLFFAGIIGGLVWSMTQLKPNQTSIFSENYIAEQQQKFGKIKQKGEGSLQLNEKTNPISETKKIRRQKRKERKFRKLEEETNLEESEQKNY